MVGNRRGGLDRGGVQPFQAYFTSGLICNGPTILIAYSWRELERISPLASRSNRFVCLPAGFCLARLLVYIPLFRPALGSSSFRCTTFDNPLRPTLDTSSVQPFFILLYFFLIDDTILKTGNVESIMQLDTPGTNKYCCE